MCTEGSLRSASSARRRAPTRRATAMPTSRGRCVGGTGQRRARRPRCRADPGRRAPGAESAAEPVREPSQPFLSEVTIRDRHEEGGGRIPPRIQGHQLGWTKIADGVDEVRRAVRDNLFRGAAQTKLQDPIQQEKNGQVAIGTDRPSLISLLAVWTAVASDRKDMAETWGRATLARMAPPEKNQRENQRDLPDATGVCARDGLPHSHGEPAVDQWPYRKPREAGCVLAALKPRAGELSPDDYAAFLEEL